MAKRRTTPQERRKYIEQQRADKKYIGSQHNVHSMDTSFIDRSGNIVRPTRDSYEALKRKRHYRTETDERGYEGGLAYKTFAIIGITGILAGLFFLSSNLTGNVIESLNQTSSNWIGGVLFIIGLVGAFAYFRRK